jgi:hypothetical protein
MGARPVLNGIESTFGRTVRANLTYEFPKAVSVAGLAFKDFLSRSTVLENASKEDGWNSRKLQGGVLSAGKSFLGTDKLVQGFVEQPLCGKRSIKVKSIETVPVKEDVYCLVADATHAFAVCGGIVVSNCYDAACLLFLHRPTDQIAKSMAGVVNRSRRKAA